MPHAGQTIKPLVALPKDPADCWPFQGKLNPTGHGTKTYMGQQTSAHRWMWMSLFGAIPPGMVVFHTCDRKDCVNPYHLRLGFQADANRAAVTTVLTAADVAEIRKAKKDATMHTAQHLAGRYGCSASLVRDIWRRNIWKKPKLNHGPGKNLPATNTGD